MVVIEKPYKEFLALCKEKGVKPPCRGRPKDVVREELGRVTDVTPRNPDGPKLKLAGKLRFGLGRETMYSVEVRDRVSGGKVALFYLKGNPLNHNKPLTQPMEKYAQVCVDALNGFFGE